MNKYSSLKSGAVALIMVAILITTTACGNASMSEGLTNASNTLTYAVVPQTIDGTTYRVLYPITKWSDSESDAFCIKYTVDGADQILWTSFNVSKAYHTKPESWEYDKTIEEMRAEFSR